MTDQPSIGADTVPSPNDCVLRCLLDRQARANPERTFVRFWRGEAWSYAQTLDRVRRRATALRDAGVRQGNHVLCWMGNGPDLLVTWFAINYLGAVYVPINTAAKGRPLAHILNNADARLMIAHSALVERLADVERGALQAVLMTGQIAAPAPAIDGLTIGRMSDPAEVRDDALLLEQPIEPWDTQAIMYTSGTTGNAKGVLFSYVQHYTMGPEAMEAIGAEDCCLIAGPIFHCGSTLYVYAMLAKGGTMAVIPEFRTADFWPAVRETGSTVVLLLGVMASFLLKAPESDTDRAHTLRKVYIVPFGEDAQAFRDRFSIDLYTVYNMTEISSPLIAGPGISEAGLAGTPRAPFELRVVDANDMAVPVGTVGELVVRSHRPWALFSGYYKNPDATVAATRNGWFHTGDAFRIDESGRFFFVDRLKDVIRRRGENISSFELEAEITAHPKIKEAVAVAVPSAVSEDEVLAVVTPLDGQTLDPAELIEFLAGRIAHYMVPRYIRIVPELPKTASGKLQKHVLRSDGVTADTWDRDAAGIRMKREALS
ncbi:probable CoA ligase [alpha proteobacterium BAL199]|jgi:carnitine-CoA ligase|nr:probable CoA ligase [alpha proteobacterium BAL199]